MISMTLGKQQWGVPQIIHFNRIFHYQPIQLLGYPHCRKPLLLTIPSWLPVDSPISLSYACLSYLCICLCNSVYVYTYIYIYIHMYYIRF